MGRVRDDFFDSLTPDQERELHERDDEGPNPFYERDLARLRERGLPVPQTGVPQIAAEPLDMQALWRSLSDADKERIGLIALGVIVGGTISAEAESTAPAASRAGAAVYHAAEEEIAMLDLPEAILAALRGPSWRIPSGLGPVCRSCGCSEHDACEDGCGWTTADRILCTACDPEHAPF